MNESRHILKTLIDAWPVQVNRVAFSVDWDRANKFWCVRASGSYGMGRGMEAKTWAVERSYPSFGNDDLVKLAEAMYMESYMQAYAEEIA